MLDDEISRNINMSKEWYLWLKDRGVNLSTISKNSHIHEIIQEQVYETNLYYS